MITSRAGKTWTTIIAILIVLLLIFFIAYPIYAQKQCALAASKHSNYIRNGEVYLSIKEDGNPYPINILQSEFNRNCMQLRFGL